MKWISVKDELPKNDDAVIVQYENKAVSCAELANYASAKNSWYDCIEEIFLTAESNIYYGQKITHWMPLPEPTSK